MFWERLISGTVLLAVTIMLVVFGGMPLWGALIIISLLGLYELYRTVELQKGAPAVIAYLAADVYYFVLYVFPETDMANIFLAAMLILMVCYVIRYPRYQIEQITFIFFGLVYVAAALSCIYRVRALQDGAYIVWLIFIGAWGSDTCAYCVGKLIGKHKLPMKLSPNKSIEGCVGGIAGAMLIGFLYGMAFEKKFSALPHPAFLLMLIGGVASVISQVGDLAASAIKRNHNIKDYGYLIPGHGGILDRFDSIIFTAPVVYLMAKLFV